MRPTALLIAATLLVPMGADAEDLAIATMESPEASLSVVSTAPHSDDCASRVNLRDGEVVWPVCFDDPSKAVMLRNRLRKAGLWAEITRVGRYERAVKYRPMSAFQATSQGEASRRMQPAAELGLYDVSVDWDPEIRSFRWELEASCPDGWVDVGDFKLTTYVLAREVEFPSDDVSVAPCGLEGTYRAAFLYGTGVQLQGSGLATGGEIVHWRGDGCFELTRCPLTASGTCASSGRTVAVDPELIPLGSEVLIEGVGVRRAEDTGGRIRGQHIDLYAGTDLTLRQANARTRYDKRVCVRDPESPGAAEQPGGSR